VAGSEYTNQRMRMREDPKTEREDNTKRDHTNKKEKKERRRRE